MISPLSLGLLADMISSDDDLVHIVRFAQAGSRLQIIGETSDAFAEAATDHDAVDDVAILEILQCQARAVKDGVCGCRAAGARICGCV